MLPQTINYGFGQIMRIPTKLQGARIRESVKHHLKVQNIMAVYRVSDALKINKKRITGLTVFRPNCGNFCAVTKM